ncbi:MAG: hypothetical protein ACOX0N_03515 [Syntrophomonadaceae bacterium]|jgi:hypothetical protein|nr:hypothetical protein [Syntrophomonadaceae bacterium]
MIIISLIINTLIFFLISNWSYLQKKKADPNYPDRPFTKVVLFPLALGIVFTLIVDAFKGIIVYQLILFLVAALLLYWIFFVMNKGNK